MAVAASPSQNVWRSHVQEHGRDSLRREKWVSESSWVQEEPAQHSICSCWSLRLLKPFSACSLLLDPERSRGGQQPVPFWPLLQGGPSWLWPQLGMEGACSRNNAAVTEQAVVLAWWAQPQYAECFKLRALLVLPAQYESGTSSFTRQKRKEISRLEEKNDKRCKVKKNKPNQSWRNKIISTC